LPKAIPGPSGKEKALTALMALPAWIIPVIWEDQVTRAVRATRVALAGPEGDRVVRVAPVGLVVAEVRAGLEAARVVPAGTGDPALGACGGIKNQQYSIIFTGPVWLPAQ
jgi:hypothetical protein